MPWNITVKDMLNLQASVDRPPMWRTERSCFDVTYYTQERFQNINLTSDLDIIKIDKSIWD